MTAKFINWYHVAQNQLMGREPIYKMLFSKTCVKRPLSKRQKIGFQDQLPLNADQNYCRMLQGRAFCNTFELH